jgi:hypothetical protein
MSAWPSIFCTLGGSSRDGYAKVVIERVRKPNPHSLHYCKAGRIDGRELVQVGAPKVGPRLFQVAQLAGKNSYCSVLIYSLSPRQRHVAVGVAIEECERFNDDRDRRVEFRARALQHVPLLSRRRVQRIAQQRKSYPRPAIDEDRLSLPHQVSSWTLSCSTDERLGSPSQIPTGPATGLRTILRIASRTKSATLRPDRAAALRSASSSSLRR